MDLFNSTSVDALVAGASSAAAGMPTWIWAGGAGSLGALALLLALRRSVKIKFGVMSIVALCSGAISSASSATTMYAVLDGTGVVFQTFFPAAFGALIAFGMVLSAKRQRLAALMIFIPSTLTSAAAFNSSIRYAEEGKETAVEQMDAVRTTRSQLEDVVRTATATIDEVKKQIGAERDALASAEARLAAAEASLVGRTAAKALDGEISTMRREIDAIQEIMDCERKGSAVMVGCVGFDGRPVLVAGQGPQWDAASKRLNGDPETQTPGMRGELAELVRQLEALDGGLTRTRDEASADVSSARQSVTALLQSQLAAEARADKARADLKALKPPKKPWAAVTWESLDDLVADNEVGRGLGFTMEGFKTFGGLWLAALFDFLASFLGVENRKRRPWRGFGGTWEAIRDWFLHGDGDVEIEGGYAADTHVITTRLGKFTGATEDEARAKAVAAERKVETAREAAQDARIDARAEAERAKAERAAEKAQRRAERRRGPGLASQAAGVAGSALAIVGRRAIATPVGRLGGKPAPKAPQGGAIFDPAEGARQAAALDEDVNKALDAGAVARGGSSEGNAPGELSKPVRPGGRSQADPEGFGGAPLPNKKSAAADPDEPVEPTVSNGPPSEGTQRGAAGPSGKTPDARAALDGAVATTTAQSGETDLVDAGPAADGASVQNGLENDPAAPIHEAGIGSDAGAVTPPADDHGPEMDSRPADGVVQPPVGGEAFETDAPEGAQVPGAQSGVRDAGGQGGSANAGETPEAEPPEAPEALADDSDALDDLDDAPEEGPVIPRDPDEETLDDVMERARKEMARRRKSLQDANEEALGRERNQPGPEPEPEPRRRARRIEDVFTDLDDEDLPEEPPEDESLPEGDGRPEEPLTLATLEGETLNIGDEADGYDEGATEHDLDEGFSVGGVAIEDIGVDASEIDNGSWSVGEEWARDHANRPPGEYPNSIAENHDGRPAGSQSAMGSLRRGENAKRARMAERIASDRTNKGGRGNG